ncbi:MAG: hypothetical protein AUK21_02910 [Parcubacteria group bacterium CG2_30_48_51]|nr:MAG: hypothetical protein AUK21_02910 [Parcubacteria group bacterium CG2_30_48_51]
MNDLAFEKNANIVVYNMSPFTDWVQGIRNRNFFIVRELAKTYPNAKLYLVDFTPQNLRRSARTALESIAHHRSFAAYERQIGGHTYLFRDTTNIFGSRWAPVYILSSIAPSIAPAIYAAASKKLLFSSGYTPGLLWSYNPLPGELFHTFPAHTRIFDAVDDWTAHPSLYKYKKQLEKGYQVIARHADAIFTVSPFMERFFACRGRTKNVCTIPNGVDTHLFKGVFPEPGFLRNIPRPRAIYVGTLQSRFDTELAEKLAKELPSVSFMYIGDVWKDIRKDIVARLQPLANVYFLGKKPYLPDYFMHADVGVMPHRRTPLMESMDPMKLYDYAAAGLPMVTTRLASLDPVLLPYVHQANTAHEFAAYIARSIHQGTLPSFPQEMLEQLSWATRFSKMRHVITSLQ